MKLPSRLYDMVGGVSGGYGGQQARNANKGRRRPSLWADEVKGVRRGELVTSHKPLLRSSPWVADRCFVSDLCIYAAGQRFH